jgi:hypothetical protein
MNLIQKKNPPKPENRKNKTADQSIPNPSPSDFLVVVGTVGFTESPLLSSVLFAVLSFLYCNILAHICVETRTRIIVDAKQAYLLTRKNKRLLRQNKHNLLMQNKHNSRCEQDTADAKQETTKAKQDNYHCNQILPTQARQGKKYQV